MLRRDQLFVLIGLCLALTACGPNEYYVPVNNQAGNAQSLSKTNDTIRVVMPYNFPELVKKTREQGKDWLTWSRFAKYNMSAKQYTEERLQALGYHVVDIGLHAGGAGHPNVIALVESAEDPSKAHNVIRTWTEPSYTDTMGNPTAWDTKAEAYTMKHIDYKVTLVRPNGANNPLFICNNTELSTNLCVAPEHPDNYEFIFTGTGSMSTDARMPSYILDHITTAVWHDYPNMMGQYKVFLYSQPEPQVIRVEPNSPKKGS
ncbi:hypothetical protein HK18_08150 [Commensalibacter intestini]|uniref:Lipoprotein n=1 Tax=Commensalibacter intestini TaxID=479936 RepID=A0A251ZUZ0_9PROT|nr:hypothetical protein [Commensalibacter intestini]OUI78481.1 hypothetical protein HK18_08150 [Commensalibacter intestini]